MTTALTTAQLPGSKRKNSLKSAGFDEYFHGTMLAPLRWCAFLRKDTPPETNSEFTPENGWLEYETRFLLGRLGLFSGAFAVSFREGRSHPQGFVLSKPPPADLPFG